MKNLKNAVVVITGASSGVGRAAALAFAREGAHVVLAARNEQALLDVARECRAIGVNALVVPTDTTSEDSVRTLVERAVREMGFIDVWVNNASAYMMGRLEDVPIDEQRQLFDVNVLGYLRGIQAVMPHFRARNRGVLVQVASVAAKVPYALTGTYCATKHAVRALSMTLRQETAGTQIEVSTVFPATIDTPLFQHAANYTGREIKAMPPVYPPERVAAAIVSAARRPRREVVVGAAPRLFAFFRTVLPGIFERIMPGKVEREHLGPGPAAQTSGNLHAPRGPEAAHGGWRVIAPATTVVSTGLTMLVLLAVAGV